MADKWTAAQMPSQAGKTIVVTGANSGVGYQAALEFARHGAHVVLGCRDVVKGEAALERLRREASGASAEMAKLDVASLSSIREFVLRFKQGGRSLEVLVNNAGVMGLPKRELTVDGFERQMGTNHFGHFALTGLLLDVLQKSAGARVVTIASLAHRNGKIEWDNLQSERKYDPMGAYNNTKLANLLFAYELDRRLKAAGSTVESLAAHPGVAKTDVFQNGPGNKGDFRMKLLEKLIPLIGQVDAQGAWPTEYAATEPGLRGRTYIGPDGFSELKGHPKIVQPRAQALDQAKAKALWEHSEELTGVRYL